ncbi:MAG: anti-sigma factor family protein [bacterium]
MNHRKLREKVGAYVDGELTPSMMKEMEEHLKTCPSCKSEYELERRVKNILKEKFVVERAPEYLRGRILQRVEELEGRRIFPIRLGRRALVLAAIALIAALIASAGHYWNSRNRRGIPPRLVIELVDQHIQHGSNPECVQLRSNNTALISSWFDERLDYAVAVPAVNAKELSMRGARLSQVVGQKVACILYYVDGVPSSLFIFKKIGGDIPGLKGSTRRPHVMKYDRYVVVLWERDDLLYSLVSEARRDRLVRIASTMASLSSRSR